MLDMSVGYEETWHFKMTGWAGISHAGRPECSSAGKILNIFEKIISLPKHPVHLVAIV